MRKQFDGLRYSIHIFTNKSDNIQIDRTMFPILGQYLPYQFLLFNQNQFNELKKYVSCSPAWSSDSPEDRSYNLYLFSLGFFLPLTLLLSTSAAALSAMKTVSLIRNSYKFQVSLSVIGLKWLLTKTTFRVPRNNQNGFENLENENIFFKIL